MFVAIIADWQCIDALRKLPAIQTFASIILNTQQQLRKLYGISSSKSNRCASNPKAQILKRKPENSFQFHLQNWTHLFN